MTPLQQRFKLGERPGSTEVKAYIAAMRADMFERCERQVANGEFMQDLGAGKLPKETLTLFWLNWHGFVAEINNIIQCGYQRHLGFFKRHVDLLAVYADKVADELVHPKPPGHMLTVWQQGEIFGLTREEMIDYEMLTECRVFIEWFRGLLYEGTYGEFWSAVVIEEYIGHWARAFRLGLEKMGYSGRTEAPYFNTHEEADLVEHEGGVMAHGEFNWAVLERLLTNGYTEFRPGFTPHYAMRTSVDLFALFHNAVHATVTSRADRLVKA
jgi:pyrroloquinoline quinone (PQQ) biosynthesis protein C